MAEMVVSAVVQEVVSRAVSFVLGKLPKKASKGYIETLEMAHTVLEFALEISSKLPITDRSLLRRRKILESAFEECGNKLLALEDQENEQGVTCFSFPKRIARTTRSSISSLVSGNSDVRKFERYAARADKFMQDLQSGYSLRQYMFCNHLIRRLLQGTTIEYRMVQGSQEQFLCIQPMNFAERGVEAFLRFSITDRKTPEKSFLVDLMLRLSESTDILGVTIKCLQPLLLPQIESAVEAAVGGLAQLPTQDIFDSYGSSWVEEFHAEATHLWRPNPECCKAGGHGTGTPPYRIPEEVIAFYLSYYVTPYGSSPNPTLTQKLYACSPEKADKDMVKDWLPLRLEVLLTPHYETGVQEGDVAVTMMEGTEVIEEIEQRNVSLHQLEEMVLPKAIDCFDHRPEVTWFLVSWQTPHGDAWFRGHNCARGF